MNTVLGNALQKALDEKNFPSFVWKGVKRKEGKKYVQDSVKIMDMSKEELAKAYRHCLKMLNNDNPKHLGRFNVLEEVNEQINKCNVELLLRYYENSYKRDERRGPVSRVTLNMDLRKLKANNMEIEDWTKVPVTEITDDLPEEFHKVNISDLSDGCIYYLGAFNKAHLTMTFIAKFGLWFTKAEENELRGETNSNIERIKIAKSKLHLPEDLVLKFNEKGLSYHEMRSMLALPKKQRYCDMTTEQLVTLRDKVLPRFLREVDNHIANWKRLMKQIELVAKSKGIDINELV